MTASVEQTAVLSDEAYFESAMPAIGFLARCQHGKSATSPLHRLQEIRDDGCGGLRSRA